MQTPFSGIIPPIVTPLRNRDELDERGLERLLEHVLDGGVKGIFALGTTGEGPSLSYRLRRHMVERTIEIVAGRVPVLVGITDTAFEESVALANYAAHCGATALVLAPPYYFAPRQPELLEYVEDLVSQLPLPTFLYNMPGLTKVHFELETVRRLSQLEKICGVKDSSGDFIYFQHLLRLARAQRSDWPVLMGPEELLGVAVLAGGDGGICGGANAFPKLYVALFEAAKKGDLPRVQTLQNAVLTLTTELYSVGKYGSSVIKGIKGALAALEICQSEMAEPFHSFHEPERVKVRAILEHLKAVLPTELAPATL